MLELTEKQIEQQDAVDDAIYDLLCDLAGGLDNIEWDMEVIGDIREVIIDYFEREGIMSEMELYPYIV